MAATSTDALLSNNNKNGTILGNQLPLFTNYPHHPVLSVTTGHNNNFWPHVDGGSNSSTSPSSDQNWDVDEEETIKRRIYELKRQFHNGRFLIFRHLPRDTTEEDIRSLLQDTLVHSVQINHLSSSARVLLVEPEVLESWSKSTQRVLNNQTITISPSNTENLLCVARLPLEYTEEDLGALASSFGEVNYSFLMRSEKTGESKGYGFIEYVNKDVALQAKLSLDGREIPDGFMVCDWLNPSHVTFGSLHSTTLYVDRLPKDYRNMGEFREIFSKVANPPYCQIAMMQGAIQNWGLVEFTSADEAEETHALVNGLKIQGSPIRVTYYIPGIRAINIYTKLLNDPALRSKGALLPEPPTNKVFTQLKNLTKQNPAFAKSLQNIILTQIQALQQNSLPPPQAAIESHLGNGALLRKPLTVPPPHVSLRPRLPPPHPLHAPIPVHLQHSLPLPLHHSPVVQPIMVPNHPPPESDTPRSLNSNAQAALLILLAAQLQQQEEVSNGTSTNNIPVSGANGYSETNGAGVNGSPNSNILSNPQVLNLLQTLVSQGDPQQMPQDVTNVHINASGVPIRSPAYGVSSTSLSSGRISNSIPNLSANLKANFRNGYFKNGLAKAHKSPLLPTPPTSSYPGLGTNGDYPEELGTVVPVLSDLLNGVDGSSQEELSSSISSLLSNTQSLQHLLGVLNHEPSQIPVYAKPHVPPPAPAPPQALVPRPPQIYQPPPEHMVPVLLRAPEGIHTERFLAPPPPQYHLFTAPPPLPSASTPGQISSQGPVLAWAEPHPQPPPVPPTQPTAVIPSPAIFQQPPAHMPHSLYSPTVFLTSPNTVAVSTSSPIIASPFPGSALHSGFSTPPPSGQKRKSNQFLPSPEPSPENGYVGQHSQGIGGHYADSYIPKKFKRQ